MAQANDTGNSTRVSIRNVPPFSLRLDERLRTRLESAADHHQQSLQKEIVARLEHSLEQDPCDSPAPYFVRKRYVS